MSTTAQFTWQRGGRKVGEFPLSADPVAAAELARPLIDLLRPSMLASDELIWDGSLDFGKFYAFIVPPPKHRSGAERGRWITRCKIDPTKDAAGVVTKGAGTPGLVLKEFARFEDMELIGECAYPSEDGAVIGWAGDAKLDGTVQFVRCLIDASKGADWGVYSWASSSIRNISVIDSNVLFCRMGISAAAGARQTLVIENVTFHGDANGSRSTNTDTGTSGGDPVIGGMLCLALNRGGSTVLRNVTGSAVGLAKQYYDTRPDAPYQRWGCPRIAALCSNWYYNNAGANQWLIDRCKVTSIVPGVATVVNDRDFRGSGANNVTTLHDVGSGPDGLFLDFAADPVPARSLAKLEPLRAEPYAVESDPEAYLAEARRCGAAVGPNYWFTDAVGMPE